MKIDNRFIKKFLLCAFGISCSLLTFNSCGSKTANNEEAAIVDEEDFYETQPLQSGLYDADYYDITGKNARKGKFDGRIYFALSPTTSAINVFENGNRTKIDYTVVMEKPFEKNDSGIYVTSDMKNNPVSVSKDSASYCLKFIHFNDTVAIGFNPKPRHVGSSVEIMEKIKDRRDKK